MSVRARRITGALGVCGVAAGCALFGAPAAFAAQEATPPELPGNVTAAIDDEHLHVELSHGWQAVTGPAADVEIVRIAAATDGLGTITGYTGNDETGRAILIFTGNDLPEFGVSIDGATIRSEDNDTDQSWYVYNDNGEFDAAGSDPREVKVSPVRDRPGTQPLADLAGAEARTGYVIALGANGAASGLVQIVHVSTGGAAHLSMPVLP